MEINIHDIKLTYNYGIGIVIDCLCPNCNQYIELDLIDIFERSIFCDSCDEIIEVVEED